MTKHTNPPLLKLLLEKTSPWVVSVVSAFVLIIVAVTFALNYLGVKGAFDAHINSRIKSTEHKVQIDFIHAIADVLDIKGNKEVTTISQDMLYNALVQFSNEYYIECKYFRDKNNSKLEGRDCVYVKKV